MKRFVCQICPTVFLLFATNASAVNIETVVVGNAGNIGEVQSQGTFGAVGYNYRIGTYEVTNAQYAEFLNAKATSDPLALYNTSMASGVGGITRSGASGSYTYSTIAGRQNMPVVYVSWYDAIRFANWLHNGQGSGNTETGAYTLLGGTTTPSNGASITRNAGAAWALASENEWYKAAYHKNDGVTGNYFDYPTASDTAPVSHGPPGGSNSANYGFGQLGDFTVGGAYALSDSPYDTFDQGGNAWEWNESRSIRGGSYFLNSSSLAASNLLNESNFIFATSENLSIGFRVVSVPEPSTFVLAALGIVGLLVFQIRRRAVGAVLLVAATAVLPTNASAVEIETVVVGNAGNAADPLTGYGAVDYDYRIGKFEVTVGQYTEFLNAVAKTDTYGLYNTSMLTDTNIRGILRYGQPGNYGYLPIDSPNHPVTYVNWGDAARFANWLHNGQPTGLQDDSTTEDGAYPLHGTTDRYQLMTVDRREGAKWFLPSENEWYKAGYHKNDGVTGNYWYTSTGPTETSGEPHPDIIANMRQDYYGYAVTQSYDYSSTQNYLTDVGYYDFAPDPYGTFDMAGNVFEWNELKFSGTTIDPFRGVRGGSWDYDTDYSLSDQRWYEWVIRDSRSIGFRVATVPEPSTLALAVLGMLGVGAWRIRRRSH